MKPILFNTEMVRVIMEGRKTVTRRVVKPQPPATSVVRKRGCTWDWSFWADCDMGHIMKLPYHPGDILWVRETWAKNPFGDGYIYPTEVPGAGQKWKPSIHMPREAARLFLRVTGVRVERLKDIDGHGILKEGIDNGKSNPAMGTRWENMQSMAFAELWNSTLKSADLPLYGWAANPWVWVIEFERISKDEALGGGGDDCTDAH